MTDLETREKKRGPPQKLAPIKSAPVKETEAYLADYFGEGSLSYRPSRPPKRPEFSKPTRTNTNATINTNGSSNIQARNSVIDDGNSDSRAEISLNNHEQAKPAISAAIAFKSLSVSEQDHATEGSISSQFSGEPAGSTTPTGEPPEQRLRSSPRLAEQGSGRSRSSWSIADHETTTVDGASEVQFDPKPMFAVPQPKTFKSPVGKENHLPRTSQGSRNMFKSMVKTDAPRFNWGRPQREVPEPQEEVKASGNNDGGSLTVADARIEMEIRESRTPLAVTSSISLLPETSSQDAQVGDASVGQSRGRSGSNRDYGESASVAKKMRNDTEPRKDFHLQISSTITQHATPQMEAQKANTSTVPGTSSASTPASIPSNSSELPKKPTAVYVVPRIHQMTIPTEHSKATIASTSAPTSPKLSRSQLLAGASSYSNMPHTKAAGTEGIAAIAQSLAVGSANAPPMPRPFFSPQEINIRTTDLTTHKPGVNIPATSAHSSTFSIQSSSSVAGLGRAELGGRQVFMVNSRPYTKLAQVGKGGSSKVYKVLASNGRVVALKKVSFEKADQVTISGYVNEVKLLQRLVSNSRIIRLWDAEISYPKGSLSLIMEYGEIDLAHMLFNQREHEFDIHFIGLYWRQMLEAVQVIHNEKIVHTDLKPANFLLVEGSLKLIDFGIANAIANDTTNIHREGHQGTANYMAPEAIGTNPGAGGSRKLGRASDVWSLGCILYQMVYGKTPFSDIINVFQKLSVIANPDHRIEFPETTPSPLQLKQQQAPPLTVASEIGDVGATLGNPAMSNGMRSLLSIPGASEVGAGTSAAKSNSNSNNGAFSSLMTATRKVAVVDMHLIQTMKGCLARDSKDRATIPELLEDRFLHPG